MRSQFEKLASVLVGTIAPRQTGKHSGKFGHSLIALDPHYLRAPGPLKVLVHGEV
ncbi:MAG: hypothetical protein QOG21_2028, partial [Actinomycetota bacterium]|nr:hypothetical protein [Actinomycetota bacterium]